MSRNRTESSRDRSIEPERDPGALYRVAGVEPHGWSTVLIEDRSGRFFIAAAATGRLAEIEAAEARRLIEDRVYRRWHGDRAWAELGRLPLVSSAFARQMPPPEPSGDTAY